MSCDFTSIPIIDVGNLLAKYDDPEMAEDPGVRDAAKQLDKACREAGFFYVTGHDIPKYLLKDVRDAAREFFKLPYDEKIKIKMSAATGFRGYQRIGENITKGAPDMHEAIDCYREIKEGAYGNLGNPMEGSNLWPSSPPNFDMLMEQYISLCTGLSRKILRGISLALSGSPYEFEGEKGGDPFWVMRIIGYPGISDPNSEVLSDSGVGCGAHTDYGLLTLVNQDDDVQALQVRNRSGEWIWAAPVPGSFVCNIGDMLKILSNGEYESTLHRVINNSSVYRTSVVYFYEPNFDAAIEPLLSCIERKGGIHKFGRAVYGEHLVGKVQANFAI